MTEGLLITLFGIGSVFLFLYVLMISMKISSYFIVKFEQKSKNDDVVAAALAIALNQKEK